MIEELLNQFASPSRRDFLKTSGRLVVGFTAAAHAAPLALGAQTQAPVGRGYSGPMGPGPYPDIDFHKLDSWIVIHQDNTATFYVGKTDLGQGTGTAFRQIMSDELDMAFDKTTCIMGNTDITVDQGGSGASDALQVDGWPMRRVAAEARRVLLDMASAKFGVPVDQLVVSDGVITVLGDAAKGDATRRVTYGELIGGNRFNVMLTGDNINNTTGKAKIKTVQQLKYSGQSPPRDDIPAKVDGSLTWAVDKKIPGMVHARNVKPPVAGATCVSVEESSVSGMPGFIRVVRERNYVAVVCEREEQAIAAAKGLKVNWQKPATAPFPASTALFDYLRRAKPTSSPMPEVTGNVETGLAGAATRLEAEYEVPFQGHTAIGPAHGMADPSNGQMTIYSCDMKAYGLRNGVAQFLQIPRDRVRVVWMQGPQGYGRSAADDAGFEAAYLAQQLGRPVRVQWMRDEETAWDAKGPAYVMKMRGGLDARGNLVALDFEAQAADYGHIGYNEPDTVLIAQLTGRRRAMPPAGGASSPDDMYEVPNRRSAVHVVSLPLVWETPLRTGNLRDPNGPQVTFAGESFIDELAAAAKADPVEFRLRLLTGDVGRGLSAPPDDSGFKRARSMAVIKAAAEKFGWDPRPSPKPLGTGNILTGRGMAYCYRSQTIVATMVEVEVNRRTGRVWVKRIVCGHDCGLVINPQALTHTIEHALMHGLSRAFYEEVTFDTEKVTSVDWRTSATLTHLDSPASMDVVIVNGDPNQNRPDLPHYGAGEAAIKPIIAAVANAIYDATGVRIRRVPLRPERVLAALKSVRA
jgi:CO/xanthine dehydrogenase Mo-binding subunit